MHFTFAPWRPSLPGAPCTPGMPCKSELLVKLASTYHCPTSSCSKGNEKGRGTTLWLFSLALINYWEKWTNLWYSYKEGVYCYLHARTSSVSFLSFNTWWPLGLKQKHTVKHCSVFWRKERKESPAAARSQPALLLLSVMLCRELCSNSTFMGILSSQARMQQPPHPSQVMMITVKRHAWRLHWACFH